MNNQLRPLKQSSCRAAFMLALVFSAVVPPQRAAAQDEPLAPRRAENRNGPWFGIERPPAPGAEPAVVVGTRAPRPVRVPATAPAGREFEAAALRADLTTIVGFAEESRALKEIGSGQQWGRVSGFPSGAKTIDWAAAQFRQAGIADVRVQSIAQDARAAFWLPLSWEVTLLGDPAFGPGSSDIVLASAIPVPPSEIPGGTLTAPLVFVGGANPSLVEHLDVKGKIAVQLTIPQGHMLFERAAVTGRAQALMKRGAVAVFTLIRLPGNELGRDFSNCGGPCVNIGGRDGLFLEQVLDRAAQAGASDKLRARIRLQTQTFRNLSAKNAVAVIPGSRSRETVIVDAHGDAWFDGAGDNADGYSVMLALARHFAKPANRPERTLVFVASAGHHTPGINGPRAFVAANPDLAGNAVLMLNVEHVAQRNFSAARTTASDGYRQAVADSGEAPVYAGIVNRSPFLNRLFEQGVVDYGVNFISQQSNMQSGETGGFGGLNEAALVTVMQAPPLYHTTGEGLDVISTPGLERMARFLAHFVREVSKAPLADLKTVAAAR
ncbi:MAG TPA: M28 family peptidase [Vicinamibacterales bacterium]|nr:M28 family peptidase [Vicinamibacterales bacterium]